MRMIAWLASGLLLAIIIFLSLAPDPVVDRWVNLLFDLLGLADQQTRRGLIDAAKIWHVLFYAALTLCLMPAFGGRFRGAALLAALVAGLMEAAQIAVPSRTARLADLVCSLAGIAIAYGILRAVRRRAARTPIQP